MDHRLCSIISEQALTRPGSVAVVQAERGGRSLTYSELDRNVSSLTAQLKAKGLNKGERVAILRRNSAEFVSALFAVSCAGGIAVPLNHVLDGSVLARQSSHCGISAIYAEDCFERKKKAIEKNVKTLRFTVEDVHYAYARPALGTISRHDPALIVYTSGTTREPLGVVLTSSNLISNAHSVIEYVGLTSKDSVHCVLPFHYIYGLSVLFSHFLAGGKVIIDNMFMYPKCVLDGIEKHGATGFAGVSSHYAILARNTDFKKRKLPSVRYFMQAGDRMSPSLAVEIARSFPHKKLYLMYGLTEASPRLAYLDPSLVCKKPSSVGKPVSGVKIKLLNRKNKECKPFEIGRITANGKNIMRGYWKNAKKTARVLRNGWLYTGDIGYKDKDGDLYIVGRKSDCVKIAANKVSLFELEEIVMDNFSVVEVAAVAVPDEILGHSIKLFVVPAKSACVTSGKIKKLFKEILPSYKRPKRVVILNVMPRNSCGKIDKERLAVL
jgi:long-chain acyl-CoA synthetase